MSLPDEVAAEVVRQQREVWDWPKLVPAWGEFVGADGETYFIRYDHTNVAHCEQIVEFYRRKAQHILDNWHTADFRRMVRACADHILRARIFRCRYLELVDAPDDGTEDEMPQFI